MRKYSDQGFKLMKKQDLLVTNLSQVELANKLGVSQPLVSKWFSGKVIPRPETIKRLANVTGTPYKELVSYFYDNYKNLV
jgi:transcriptional regulator with XRE-family HTH domain